MCQLQKPYSADNDSNNCVGHIIRMYKLIEIRSSEVFSLERLIPVGQLTYRKCIVSSYIDFPRPFYIDVKIPDSIRPISYSLVLRNDL